MTERIAGELEPLGFQARVVSIRRLPEMKTALESQHAQGLFDEGFYQDRLAEFDFNPPKDLPGAKSLIIVGYADPNIRFTFTWEGEEIPVFVPPTYLHYQEKDRRAKLALDTILAKQGCRAVEARLPKKLLAARSGLTRYGRNNITYAENTGSFYRLVAFASDLPCEDDEWREAEVLERCESCAACMTACPTGAIDPGRFLLRAERCITFWNEEPSNVPFPDWLAPSWHNCLVGCLHCQRVCPENRDVSDFCELGAEFSEEETRLIMEGRKASDLPPDLLEKLEQADLLEYLDAYPRNLGALLARAPE